MKINLIVLLIALIAAPFCSALNSCEEKKIVNDDYSLINNQSDVNYAYNEAASCASLNTEKENALCCYIKIKFKNELIDETFTQKGCYEVEMDVFQKIENDTYDDFKEFKDEVEENIENKNGGEDNIDIKSLSIDCSSKYLHLAGLALLFFFL